MSDKFNNLTDAELSEELHRRRKQKRDFLDAEYQKFASQLIILLTEFEKLTGKRIEKRGWSYQVVEEKEVGGYHVRRYEEITRRD